jgi:aminoglycoside 3-N-acetyltransferase
VIAEGLHALGIAGKPLCIHVSLRSFGRGVGPADVIDGVLSTGSTVLIPTMAGETFAIPAPSDDRPAQNGLDYAERDRMVAENPWPGMTDVYDHTRTETDSWLGATPAYVAARPDRVRVRTYDSAFAAVGPLARELIAAEDEDSFGPLRELARRDGWVVLMGVDLTKMTAIHLAEVIADRRPFVRWARGADGEPVRILVGDCSNGFERLAPALAPVEKRTVVGQSEWRAFPLRDALELAAAAIRADSMATHCDDADCLGCRDAALGGPLSPLVVVTPHR